MNFYITLIALFALVSVTFAAPLHELYTKPCSQEEVRATSVAPKDAVLAARVVASKSSNPASKPWMLHIELSNNLKDKALKICTSATPLLGVVNTEHQFQVFDVTDPDAPLRLDYIGMHAKRATPKAEQYLHLGVGESYSALVDLSTGFRFSPGRSYVVKSIARLGYSADHPSPHVMESDEAGLFASLKLEPMHLDSVRFVATEESVLPWVQLEQQRPSVPLERHTVSVKAKAKGFTPLDSTSYSSTGCGTTATTQNAEAVNSAYVEQLHAHYSFAINKCNTGNYYTTYFGTFLDSRATTVKNTNQKLIDNLSDGTYIMDCTLTGCSANVFAFVYPTQTLAAGGPDAHRVHLCNVYFSSPGPMNGVLRDTKAGTLIHELSHFDDIGNTNDFAYNDGSGGGDILTLPPSQMVFNAENYEYFTELSYSMPSNCYMVDPVTKVSCPHCSCTGVLAAGQVCGSTLSPTTSPTPAPTVTPGAPSLAPSMAPTGAPTTAPTSSPTPAPQLAYTAASSTTYSWVATATHQTLNTVSTTDDGVVNVDVSTVFPITFGGEQFTQFWAQSNGFVTFMQPSSEMHSSPTPVFLDLMVTPLWDNWDPSVAGTVTVGDDGVAPNRRLIVSWNGVQKYGTTGTGNRATFQIVFHETSGKIIFQYQKVSLSLSNYSNGATAAAGMKTRSEQRTFFYKNSDTVADNTAFEFSQTASGSSGSDEGVTIGLSVASVVVVVAIVLVWYFFCRNKSARTTGPSSRGGVNAYAGNAQPYPGNPQPYTGNPQPYAQTPPAYNPNAQGPVYGQPVPMSATGLPQPWQEHRSDTGAVYYYNPVTGASEWNRPVA